MTKRRNSPFWILTFSLLFLHSHSAAYDLTSLLTPNTAAFQISGSVSGGDFGIKVSNAGDVNNDNIDDIIIGAPAASLKGQVHIIYGKTALSFADFSVSGLAQAAGFKVTGNAAGDSFGFSVSSAGDFDNDGYDDVIIGAPAKESNRGAVYIVFGNAYTAHLDLDISVTALQPTTTGFMIRGNAADDLLGYAVGAAGDINNDGYADIVIGAPGKNSNAGAVYVIYGKSKGSILQTMDLSTTPLDPATTGFTILGSMIADILGSAVSSAGKINNDQYDDIIIGAPGKNSEQGAAYIVYGASTFPPSSYTNLDPSTLNPATTGFMVGGASPGDTFGISCGNAGDMNGDSKNEIFIAAEQANSGRGGVYIIYGQTSGFLSNIDLSSTTLDPTVTGFVITGDVTNSGFGTSVAPAGDVTGDGYADVILGAPSNSKVYVIYGGQKATRQNILLASINLDPLVSGFAITGTSGSGFGSSVSVAGGFQLNSKAGLLVGAPQINSIGSAYVIFPSKMCANNCLACTQLQTCTQCDAVSGYGLENSVCVLCPAGKYSSGTDACINDCPLGCGQCHFNPGSLTCTSCLSGYFSTGSIVNCQPCPTGCTACSSSSTCTACLAPQYHLVSSICCPLSCSACSSGSVCTACNPSFGLVAGQCQTCPSGTYLSSGDCPSCSSSMSFCATCTSSSVCTGCSSGFLLVTSTSSCVSSCPSETYQVNTNCEDCSNSCENCLGSSSTCTSCSGGTFLDMSLASCVSTCPDETFSSTMSGKCEACDNTCATCTGSASFCASCPFGSSLLVSSCVSPCPTGTYEANGKCESCSSAISSCSACTSGSICTSCSSGLFVYNSQCVPFCPPGTYPNNGVCENCPSLCSSCSNSLNGIICTGCDAGFGLYMHQCLYPCPGGTYLDTSGRCESCSVVGCATCPDASTCTACDAGLALYLSKCVSLCPDGTYLANGKCYSCPGTCTKCKSSSFCEACHEGYILSDLHSCDMDHQEEEVKNGREKAAGDTFEGSSLAGAALASGSSLPINFGLVAKIIRNLKYLNVTVSVELQKTFYSWKVNSGFLRAPKSWSSVSQSKPLPVVFSRYGLDPVFLINYWKPLILTLIGFVLFIVFKIIEVSLNKNNKQAIPRKLNLAASNFALTQVYSNLDDVILYFVLDARSTELDDAFRGFSLTLAFVLIAAGVIILGFHGFLLQKYQSIKKDKTQTDNLLKKFLYKYENVKLIFKDFKDTTLLTQSFLWIHLVRAMISSLLITTLFEYPLVQVLLLLFLNIGMITFIGLKSPFKDVLSTCSQLFCEIILLLANICMLIMALFDQTGSYPVDAIKSLSTSVIVLNAILLFGSAILMVVAILKDLYMAYQARKNPPQIKNNRLNVHADKLNSTNTGEGLQQNSSVIVQELDYTRNYDYEPTQNYSQAAVIGGGGGRPTILYDLNTNGQNQLEISDISYDVKGLSRGNPNNFNFNQGYQENNFGQFESNTIDETIMNTSNVDLLQSHSPMKAVGSFLKPKIRGKIKMPGGVVWNPRSDNGIASPSIDFQSSPSIQYNNPRPTNMEISSPERNHLGFGDQSRSPGQKKNFNNHEEFILERTRARVKYHDTRKTPSYKETQG